MALVALAFALACACMVPGAAYAAAAQEGSLEAWPFGVGACASQPQTYEPWCASPALKAADTDDTSSVTSGDEAVGQEYPCFKKVGKKTYYYEAEGKKATGWREIEGSKYYFAKNGAMETGLVKIGKDYYFFDQGTGHMAGMGWYKNWCISYTGKCYKMPKKTADKTASGNRVADLIVKCVGPKKYWKKAGNQWQLYQVRRATYYVWVLAWRCKYTTQGNDYYTPYGVFYAKKYSCAGTAAALKLVLDKMGYKCTHTHKNQWTHQWVKLKMDGKMGYADAFPTGGGADYGKHPVEKKK